MFSVHTMRIITFILCFLFFSTFHAYATAVDSIIHTSFEKKITAIQDLYEQLEMEADTAKVVPVFYELIQKSTTANDNISLTLAYNYLGQYLSEKNNLVSGLSYLQKAHELSMNSSDNILVAIVMHTFGYQGFKAGRYAVSLEKMLKSNEIMQQTGYDKFPGSGRYLYELADVYYKMNYPEKTIPLLQLSRRLLSPGSPYVIFGTNTLALSYKNIGRSDSASSLFNEALLYAVQQKNDLWIGVTSGNIANIHIENGQYEKAYELIMIDRAASLRHKDYKLTSMVMMLLARVAIARANFPEAHHYLDTALLYKSKASVVTELFDWDRRYFQIRSQLFAAEQNWKAAYVALDSAGFASTRARQAEHIKMVEQIEKKNGCL